MKLTSDTPVFPPSYCGGEEDIMLRELYPEVFKTIVENQAKAKKYDNVMKGIKALFGFDDVNEFKNSYLTLEDENKQLKEIVEKIKYFMAEAVVTGDASTLLDYLESQEIFLQKEGYC